MQKKLIKRMRKFILKHGNISKEYRRPPDKYFRAYRKGSYFISFVSDDLAAAVGDSNKYYAYKSLYYLVKEYCH